MRTDLTNDPRVLGVAARLGVSSWTAVGLCFGLWAMADTHTRDGRIAGMTGDMLDTTFGVKGFSDALKAVKPRAWLDETDDGVFIPRFGDHNGATAKKRAQTALRASRFRNAPSVTNGAPSKEHRAEQAESKQRPCSMTKSNAPLPEFSVGDDACSLLRTIGMDDGAIRYLTSLAGVDDGQVYWACERTRAAMVKARKQGGKPVKNPAAYCRNLIERKRPPQGWRDEWNRKRLAEQAAKVGGLKIAGG